MKTLPRSVDEWRGTILFCLAFPFLVFTFLPFIALVVIHLGIQSRWTRWRIEEAIWWIVEEHLFLPALACGVAVAALAVVYAFLDRRRATWALAVVLLPIIFWFLALPAFTQAREKPVIYLYPTEKVDVRVHLQYPGVITASVPTYQDGWNVTASPSGRLIDKATGQAHQYLFWEGNDRSRYTFDSGFVVSGRQATAFLREVLPSLGLVGREVDDFVEFWGPRLAANRWNVIGFPNRQYSDSVPLRINPSPDSIIRVFMVFAAVNEPPLLTPPEIDTPDRLGFTVVEWGGTELK